MADKTTELERIYTIPLRRAKMGTRSKRADRAVRDVREFLMRNMKTDAVWIAGEVNELLWARGKFRIPSKVRVRATRFSDGVVEVTLPESEVGSVREQIQDRQEKAAESPVLVPAGAEEMEEGLSEAAQGSVTDITGVGPATAEKLEKIGIETVADLAHASASTVAEATGKSKEDAQAWIDEAHALAHATESEEEATSVAADSEEE